MLVGDAQSVVIFTLKMVNGSVVCSDAGTALYAIPERFSDGGVESRIVMDGRAEESAEVCSSRLADG